MKFNGIAKLLFLGLPTMKVHAVKVSLTEGMLSHSQTSLNLEQQSLLDSFANLD